MTDTMRVHPFSTQRLQELMRDPAFARGIMTEATRIHEERYRRILGGVRAACAVVDEPEDGHGEPAASIEVILPPGTRIEVAGLDSFDAVPRPRFVCLEGGLASKGGEASSDEDPDQK